MLASSWGASVVWEGVTVSVGGFDTLVGAQTAAWEAAYHCGYTLPRWWQFWRWSEQRPPSWFKAPISPPATPAPPSTPLPSHLPIAQSRVEDSEG